MSDSGSDISPSNVIKFKGPEIDRHFSLNNNGNSSVQQFRDEIRHRNLRYRELSPTMSLRSIDMGSRNFQQSFCNGRFAQSSMIYGREGRAVSPSASMLSTGSNISTAATIVSAINSGRFDYHEWKSIRNAVNKRFKNRNRKKIYRRRNIHMRGARRSSGEFGSDSSMSSDECKSTRTGYNIDSHRSSQFRSSYQNTFLQKGRINDDTRSAKTEFAYSRHTQHNNHNISQKRNFRNINSLSNNITQNVPFNKKFLHIDMVRDDIKSFQSGCADLRQTIKDNTILTDCTNNLKQNVFRNMLSQGQKNDGFINNQNQINRFSSFLLPSQRFKNSSTVLPIPEEYNNNLEQRDKLYVNERQTRNNTCNGFTKLHKDTAANRGICDNTDTDDDIIFSEVTDPEKSILKQPNSHNVQNFKTSDGSLSSLTEKAKPFKKAIQNRVVSGNNDKDLSCQGDEENDLNDFVFAKPLSPSKIAKNNNPAIKMFSLTKPVPKDNVCDNTDTEDDNIFSEVTDPEKNILKQPNSHNVQNFKTSDGSLSSLTEKAKPFNKAIQNCVVSGNNDKDLSCQGDEENDLNDFVFAKPLLPSKIPKNNNPAIKMFSLTKPVPKDNASSHANKKNLRKDNTVISEDHSETLQNDYSSQVNKENFTIDNAVVVTEENSETLQSDVSSRPSFTKRKLFTQTLDMTENKSLDSSPGISPKKVYKEILKEKCKTRKLVTNQSCLSRDIPGEKNNIVDLIRKFVPPKKMNVTSNITHNRLGISATLVTCGEDDVSDTYTDEDIFDGNKPKRNENLLKTCSVITDKSNVKELNHCKSNSSIKPSLKDNGVIKNIVNPLADSFWNTDSESETPVKHVNKGISFIKKIQKPLSIKKSVPKHIKSLLESTKSGKDNLLSLENMQKIEVSKNRSLRLRALKALKDIRQTSTKQNELQKSIYDILNKEKKIRQNLKSSLNNTNFITNILTGEKNVSEPTEVIKEKILDKNSAPKNGLRNQNVLDDDKKPNVQPISEIKGSEDASKNITKANLNISKRGRPKNNDNDTITSTKNTTVAKKTITLRNRTIETPNVSSEQGSLNISYRTRSSLKKMAQTNFEASLNTSRRGRPKKTTCTTTTTEKNKESYIVGTTKGKNKTSVPAGVNTLKYNSSVTNNKEYAKRRLVDNTQIMETGSQTVATNLQERPRVEQTGNGRDNSMPLASMKRRRICIDDDAESVIARSVASSAGIQTRSRRLKFLHL